MSSYQPNPEDDLVPLVDDPETFIYKTEEFTEARVLKPRWQEKRKKQEERKATAQLRKAKTAAKKEVKKGKQASMKHFLLGKKKRK